MKAFVAIKTAALAASAGMLLMLAPQGTTAPGELAVSETWQVESVAPPARHIAPQLVWQGARSSAGDMSAKVPL
ncbi:MAG: hypothetical protein DIU71_16645 [Proteobacteria bacterium]|nr:MAG: hypothetical protein DIU71_16645 [Pseudomonadota bacterium]